MKRKENFQWLPKELHQLKYEAISVPQGSVRLVKKTQERKSSTCYLLITKGVTSSSPVPLKTRRERERHSANENDIVRPKRLQEVIRMPLYGLALPVHVVKWLAILKRGFV
ncbi:uncharacterized protein TNCV_545001 [Trichonephila clavipes]|nr:uncharacterized protein TNCV_545001 [Trichonephila clavipes]